MAIYLLATLQSGIFSKAPQCHSAVMLRNGCKDNRQEDLFAMLSAFTDFREVMFMLIRLDDMIWNYRNIPTPLSKRF